MKTVRTHSIHILLVASSLLQPAYAAPTGKSSPSKQQSPIEVGVNTFKKLKSVVTRLPVDCLSFQEDGPMSGESDMDLTVREKHGGQCEGDLSTAPTIANLRVKGKKVYILDVVSGEYQPFNSKWKPSY